MNSGKLTTKYYLLVNLVSNSTNFMYFRHFTETVKASVRVCRLGFAYTPGTSNISQLSFIFISFNLAYFKVSFSFLTINIHAVIKLIFYIDHIKNADNWVSTILDMQISKCNVISGYVMIDSSCGLIHAVIPLKEE